MRVEPEPLNGFPVRRMYARCFAGKRGEFRWLRAPDADNFCVPSGFLCGSLWGFRHHPDFTMASNPEIRWKQRFQNFDRAFVLLRDALENGPDSLNP
jgi:hypothetical protein